MLTFSSLSLCFRSRRWWEHSKLRNVRKLVFVCFGNSFNPFYLPWCSFDYALPFGLKISSFCSGRQYCHALCTNTTCSSSVLCLGIWLMWSMKNHSGNTRVVLLRALPPVGLKFDLMLCSSKERTTAGSAVIMMPSSMI